MNLLNNPEYLIRVINNKGEIREFGYQTKAFMSLAYLVIEGLGKLQYFDNGEWIDYEPK